MDGTGILYDTEGTTVKPGFIDENGMIVLDKDGTPRDSNFFLDLRDGSAYFRGTVYANGGRFKGSVYGDNYYFNDGGSVRTLISEAGVDFSKMKRIDLGGIVLDGETGNISFTGAGSITWGDNTPVKYQFSTSLSGPWHDTMQTNDKYRRDSLDGGTTWGTPYQFKGTDGTNGKPGTVDYAKVNQILKETYGITETFITGEKIGSPVIQGAQIYGCEIYAGGNGEKGGQIIGLDSHGIAVFNGSGMRVLTITGVDGVNPRAQFTTDYNSIIFSTPYISFQANNTAYFKGAYVDFTQVGEVDFTGAKVNGVHATFA